MGDLQDSIIQPAQDIQNYLAVFRNDFDMAIGRTIGIYDAGCTARYLQSINVIRLAYAAVNKLI